MGYAGYHRRFIKNLSQIVAPLYALIGNVEFHWTDKCDTAFAYLNKMVSKAPILRRPNWKLPCHISLDASDTTIGAVLGRRQNSLCYLLYQQKPHSC